jgi:hypothetical protein
MKTLLAAITVLFTIAFVSCKGGMGSKERRDDQTTGLTQSSQTQVPAGSNRADSIPALSSGNTTAFKDWDRYLIKTGDLKVETQSFKKFNDEVRHTVRSLGGYIAKEDQSVTGERSGNEMVIKVPVLQFELMMTALPGSEGKLLERKISSDEVGTEMVDTKSRIEAKMQMRLKYLEFLRTSKNMEEVLQVQKEINNLQEQIESAKGRVGYLSNQSALSTINFSFFEPAKGIKPVDDDQEGFFSKLATAFNRGAASIGQIFIGLIGVWPLLLIAVLVFIGWKKWKPVAKNTNF